MHKNKTNDEIILIVLNDVGYLKSKGFIMSIMKISLREV